MGKKLLKTMGWREGQGVGIRVRRKRKRAASGGSDESPEEEFPDEARAGLGKRARELVDKEGLTFAPKNTNLTMQAVITKTNLHGIGHEPFKDAPEFGAPRGARDADTATRSVYRVGDIAQSSSKADGVGVMSLIVRDRGSNGFVLDDAEDDVYEAAFGKEAYDDTLDAEKDNTSADDSLAGTSKAWALGTADCSDNVMLASRRYARCPSDGRLPPLGFIVAQRPDGSQKHWAPPIPPANFDPVFKFEEGVRNPLTVYPSKGCKPPGLDSSRRSRLLGEPSHRLMNNKSIPPPTLSDQDSPLLPGGSSTLSFLSPAARKKVLNAANGARVSSGSSSLSVASTTPVVSAVGAAAERFVGTLGAEKKVNYAMYYIINHNNSTWFYY